MELRPWPELQAALPPLGDEAHDELTALIAEHGILDTIKALPDGRIIDGHHRWEIGGRAVPDDRIEVMDLDEETAYALGLLLNAARRQMRLEETASLFRLVRETRAAARAMIVQLDKEGRKQEEIAEMVGYTQQGVSKVLAEAEATNTTRCIGSDVEQEDRRSRRGRIPRTALEEIRRRRESGDSAEAIGRSYGVTDKAIWAFVARWEGKDPTQPTRNPRRRFTDEQETEIEARYRAGENMAALASIYGCEKSTIGNVVDRVRARWDREGPPPVDAAPTNVVDFPAKQGRAGRTEPPPRRTYAPAAIQTAAMDWLKRAQDVGLHRLDSLRHRFGDQLESALAGTEEGRRMEQNLDAMARRYAAFANAIRRLDAGTKERGRDRTSG